MNNAKKKKRKNNGKQHNSLSQLEQINLNAAGIDIGAEEHYIAVPQGRDPEGEDVRHFNTFTVDLLSLADWLKKCKIDTVAMESTGVYWIPLFEILDSHYDTFSNLSYLEVVTPVKTGVQRVCNCLKILDSGFRRNDGKWGFSTSKEVILIKIA